MENPWPAGVPTSLWTYNQLRAEELVQVPMMGIRFAPGFLYTFVFGCIFIALFAWKRFSVRSEVHSVSRALSDLSPSEMGGQGALLRAYFIYAGSILLLYVSLTFFGRLILQSAQMLPVAGIQVNLNKLQFDSMQWPLMLAFAFAGLAEMLPPVKMTEGWLRNRAYRAVGIPVRLEQTMRSLIVALDRACAAGPEIEPNPLSAALASYRERWTDTIARHAWAAELGTLRRSRQDEAVSLLSQLEMLVFWAKAARGSWPGHEVSQSVRQMERKFVDESVTLLDEIHHRMLELPTEGADAGTVAHKTRFSEYLGDAIDRAEKLRFDLVGILAIFLERDLDVPMAEPAGETREKQIEARQAAKVDQPEPMEPALNQLLIMTERPDTAGTGPEAGLFLALIAVFLFYAAAAWRGVQEPIGQFIERTNLYGVLVTALVETLRIAALTWLPILAAFSLRQYLWDNGDWARATRTHRRSGYAMQIFGCLCLGAAVSMIALAGVAALRAFFVAPDADYFFSLYFGGVAFVLYYPTQAIILVALIPIALRSADLRQNSATRMWLGMLCALCVGFLSIQHQNYWNPTLARDCPGLVVISSLDCARRFDLVGHVILALLAFLAAGVFGELPERIRRTKPRWATQTTPVALLLLATLQSHPAAAQVATAPREVYVGFRTDTPPFSSGVAATDNSADRPYEGYLADICFDLFAGYPQYRIIPVPISAQDRFIRIRSDGAASGRGDLDMLCDAVTMRFSDPERASASIFSPVVFASGVSFLDRTRSGGTLIVGYVENSTARDVARKVCEVDYFKGLLPSQRSSLYQRCKLRWSAALVVELLQRKQQRPVRASPAHYPVPGDPLWTRLGESWSELLDAGRRLKQSGIDPDRLDPESRDLLNKVTKHPTQPVQAEPLKSACLSDGDDRACLQALDLLSDPLCQANATTPPRGNTPIEKAPWPDYHFCPMATHDQLIEWFCTTPPGQRRIYMGDRELILGKMQGWTRVNGPCDVERPDGAEYLSYEPYAFPISLADPVLVQFVQRRVYELFSHRAEMTGRFQASFQGRGMSPALAYLFLLNAVENEEMLGPRPPIPETPEAETAK
ncbi:hypothetical protein [Paracoccus ravus]|uniref:hypothetical protein n=1 Tax=Paracoccus ravus TaxID=2447760 RepID=UPI00106EF64B|nr:hypothetical protein [Paracoccus ravus]